MIKRLTEEHKFSKFGGITLISLVITIMILIILVGIGINLALGKNGLFTKAKEAKEETNKQIATEKIILKITTSQINKYAEKQEMPTLKELSVALSVDNEIDYVTEVSQIASTKYEVGEKPTTIFTKLKEYPYEFEINGQLQIASINGEKIITSKEENGIENAIVYVIGYNTESEIKTLPKGNYKLIYMSSSFSWYNCCPIVYLYKDEECIITGENIVYNQSGAGGTAYACTSDIVPFELEEESEVQIKLSNGNYYPYAIAIVIPDN